MESGRSKNSQVFFIYSALIVLTLAAFWPVRFNEFINYDDQEYIYENSHVQAGLTWAGLRWAFTTGHASNWHPLTWLSHMLDIQLFGLHPAGHHLTSVAFHIVNSLLLFSLFFRLTAKLWRSALVAALFAVHPLHVESVAWAAERKDVLSAFFFFLTLHAYTSYAKRCGFASASNPKAEREQKGKVFSLPYSVFSSRRVYFSLALVLFTLGLMSKPMLVTVPFVLLLLDYWPLRRFELKARTLRLKPLLAIMAEKSPFVLLAVASSIVTFLTQRAGETISTTDAVPIYLRFGNALLAYAAYLRKIFWPADLCVFYPFSAHLSVLAILGAAVLLISVSFLAFRKRSDQPWLGVGWLWFLITLVPVIGLVQVGMQSLADRYTYIPAVGVFISLVWLISELCSALSWRATPLSIMGGTAVLACALLTRNQLDYWRNSEALFRRALAVTRENYVAHSNLGAAAFQKGDLQTAQGEFQIALVIRPDHLPALYGLAGTLQRQGRHIEAEALLDSALGIAPQNPWTHFNLALVLSQNAKSNAAIEQYRQALRLQPKFPEALNNLANLLLIDGHVDEGLDLARQALRLDPNSSTVLFNVANGLFLKGDLTSAIAHYRAALRSSSEPGDVLLNLAKALLSADDSREAEQRLKELLSRNPDHLEAHQLLAGLYQSQHRDAEATAEQSHLLRLAQQPSQILKTNLP